VKSSGRDEPIRVVIHMYMEAMLGISLYSYLYLRLAKMLCLSYYLLCFLFNKIEKRTEQFLPGSEGCRWWWWGQEQGERWPKQCIHILINE
jgi:hypothetical protein